MKDFHQYLVSLNETRFYDKSVLALNIELCENNERSIVYWFANFIEILLTSKISSIGIGDSLPLEIESTKAFTQPL